MRKPVFAVIVFACLFLLSAPAFSGGPSKAVSENAEAQKLIDQAWALERTDSNAQIYKQCVDLLEKANQLDPDNHMILADLGRYYWNYGDNLPKETEKQQKKLEGIYEKGLSYAEKSLELKKTASGHYWIAVNKAASLEFSSIFAQAAAFPGILKHSEAVGEIDPDYYYGASGRLWSEILVRVPKVVVEMVGYDVQEVVDEIDGSIKKEPRYINNYVYKARFIYTYFESKNEALSLLDQALKKDPNALPDEATSNRAAQRDARELWKEITGKEYPNK